MYAAGVRCTDCHDAHIASAFAVEGNGVCQQCHGTAANESPSLPAAAGTTRRPTIATRQRGAARNA